MQALNVWVESRECFFKVNIYNQCKIIIIYFFNFGLSQPLFLILIFHQFSKTIQYYLVIICPLAMMTYPHRWWFLQLWSSPISRARMTHSAREHRRRESVVGMHINEHSWLKSKFFNSYNIEAATVKVYKYRVMI